MKQYKILHLFRWRIVDIVNVLPQIKEQGFNAILISPIQECREGWEWWKLYQNLSYNIGNYVGDFNDLKTLCWSAETLGIDIFADILLHNVASMTGDDVHPDVDQNITKHIDVNVPQCTNWEDRYQSTHYKTGLPIVPYWKPEIQAMHKELIEKFIEAGVKGLRIDMLKHFATPEEGSNYIPKVFNQYKNKLFLFGEVLNAPKHIIDMYAKYMKVCTEFIKTDKEKIVTFVESHDEYYGIKNKTYLTKEMIINNWNELVNINKVHSIFFVRPMEDEKGLSNLWLDNEIKKINGGR